MQSACLTRAAFRACQTLRFSTITPNSSSFPFDAIQEHLLKHHPTLSGVPFDPVSQWDSPSSMSTYQGKERSSIPSRNLPPEAVTTCFPLPYLDCDSAHVLASTFSKFKYRGGPKNYSPCYVSPTTVTLLKVPFADLSSPSIESDFRWDARPPSQDLAYHKISHNSYAESSIFSLPIVPD